jgi:hypothetical protein
MGSCALCVYGKVVSWCCLVAFVVVMGYLSRMLYSASQLCLTAGDKWAEALDEALSRLPIQKSFGKAYTLPLL